MSRPSDHKTNTWKQPTTHKSVAKNLLTMAMVMLFALFLSSPGHAQTDPGPDPRSQNCIDSYEFCTQEEINAFEAWIRAGGNPTARPGIPITPPEPQVGADLDRGDFLFRMSYNQVPGQSGNGTFPPCLACNFVLQYGVALMTFSAAVYLYFSGVFLIFVPTLMAIWLTWRSMALFAMGGAGGRKFINEIAKNLTLFFFAFIVVSAGGQSSGVFQRVGLLWEVSGPLVTRSSMKLASEIRDNTIDTINNQNPDGGVMDDTTRNAVSCPDVGTYVRTHSPNNLAPITRDALVGMVNVACGVERMHVIGMSMGFAMIGTILRAPAGTGAFIIFLAFLLAGFSIALVGMSAIWFTFLILDAFTKGVILAMVSPIMLALIIFPVTRKMGWRVLRGFVSIPFITAGIGMINALGFFLIMNITNVYDRTREYVKSSIYHDSPMTLAALDGNNTAERLMNMVQRAGLERNADLHIPMTLNDPWTIYMILVFLSLFALGKKVMAIIGNMLPDKGDQNVGSAMADTAQTMAYATGQKAVTGAATMAVGMAMATKGGVGGVRALHRFATSARSGLNGGGN